jgi:hypothetical protein
MMGVKSRYSKPSTGEARRGAVAISSVVAPKAKGGVRHLKIAVGAAKDRPSPLLLEFSRKRLAPTEPPSPQAPQTLRLRGKKPQP